MFCERVGGGFGGKQEMLVEDIVALAALRTGRPVKLEFTREEQFVATSTRHPMRVTVKAGADKDGKLTALQLRRALQHRRLWQPCRPGAVSRRAASRSASTTARTRRSMRVAAYTNTVPSGAFRGYGLPQTLIRRRVCDRRAGKQLGIDPFDFRRRNVVKPGDPMLSPPASEYHDVLYGSYGLDQCLDLVERAMAGRRAEARALRRLAGRRGHRADHDRYRAAGRPSSPTAASRCATTAATS